MGGHFKSKIFDNGGNSGLLKAERRNNCGGDGWGKGSRREMNELDENKRVVNSV